MPAVLGGLLVVVPLVSTALSVDWPSFLALITSASSTTALVLSLGTASLSAAVCLLLGVPMALVLARARFPGRSVVRALVLVPLVLPPVVGGLALLATFGRRGLLGPALEATGIPLAFSTAAVVIAQIFVSLPFVVISLEGALATQGDRFDQIAASLGAGRLRTFRRVTLPLLAPAVVSGTILAFARSLGEFGATLTFAGSLQGTTRTLPLEIYLQREVDPDAALALSLVLVAVAVIVVVLARGRRSGLAP